MSRLALLVANNSFRDVHSTLVSPLHDARDLRDVLRDPAIGNFEPVEVLENESKATIEREIEQLFHRARPGDLVLLYFSGHGVRGRRGKLHLAVSNTDPETNLAATSVSASFIKERIEESHAASVVVLLDCCYSGSFVEPGIKAGSAVDVGGELNAGQGVYILTATDAIQPADDGTVAEDGTVGRSRFTTEIVRGIRTGLADVTGSGFITPQDLGRFARSAVPDKSTRQSPQEHGSVSADTVLARVKPTFGGVGHLDSGLASRIRLGDLLGPLAHTPDRGLRAEEWRGLGHLAVPIGRAFHGIEPGQVVPLRLGDQGGHFLTTGQISSGKSSLLRTLVCALALTHTPDELRFCVFESGANKLGSLGSLPHLESVVGDDQGEQVHTTLTKLSDLVGRRKVLFRENGISSAAQFRDLRSRLSGGPHPDIVVIVDQWTDFAGRDSGIGDTNVRPSPAAESLRPTFADRIAAIAHVGRDYGVHIAVAARRWNDLPPDLLELFSSYVEFRLPDPAQSRLDVKLASRLSTDQQGWALYHRTRFRVALPDLRSGDDALTEESDAFNDGGAEVVRRVSTAWTASTQPVLEPPSREEARPVTTPVPEPRFDEMDAAQFTELLGIDDLDDFDPARTWSPRPQRARLRIPLGFGPDGRAVELDIKEAAQGGMGPHGLMIGAAGAGKSAALRSLVLTLAATHDPREFNVALVDFNGDSTFDGLEKLPHTAMSVSNLAAELALVERLKDTLEGELVRRQAVLRDTGNFNSQRDYERARFNGVDVPPLPSLLVVCDEFSELLAAKPEFIDVFIQIGRIGRALGVHMLLASRRLEDGQLRGAETYLSYRIGLRTHSAVESRTLLGVSDAYELPRAPGHGYLRVGTEPLQRFRTPDVSARLGDGPEPVLETVVSKLADHGTKAREIWLPPLSQPETIDGALAIVRTDPDRHTEHPLIQGQLIVPISIADDVVVQRRSPQWLELSGAGGNVAVVGAPRSGKSTALRTIIAGLAVTHSPNQVAVYCLDFGGGSLRDMAGLPHVGGVYRERDIDQVRRTVAEVSNALETRQDRFAERGIDSMSTYRRMRAEGKVTDDPRGDIFLVVDGWRALRDDMEDLELEISQIARRGLPFGVHVVVATERWNDFRPSLRDLLGSKVELKLGDAYESIVGRRLAERVPADRPGHGVTADGLQQLILLPRIDGLSTVDDLSDGVADLVRKVKDAWHGPSVPPVRMLPRQFPYHELPTETHTDVDKWRIPIGIAETDLEPVFLDFAANPHFMYFADTDLGKSAFLRQLIKTITTRFAASEAQFVVFDYLRSLLGTVPDDYLVKHCYTPEHSAQLVRTILDVIRKRLPKDDVTPQQLRDRSWWTGPELFAIIDDYDLVGPGFDNPLLPLLEIIPQARDVGFHVIVTRHTSGANRELFGKFLGGLRDLATPGFQGGGSPNEGKLLGDVRLSEQPPGRGWLIDRQHGARKIQTAWLPEPAQDAT